MHDRIRVLFLASDPFRDRAPLRLNREVRAIGHALRKGRAHEGVELIPHFARRTRDLRDALLRHDPRIVHFAGHGDGAGIYLGDARGVRRRVPREALGNLFRMLSEWIRVVVLNGHETLPLVETLGQAVDHAVGMDRPLGDRSAIVFAAAFYGALGTGQTVQASFDLAVTRLRLEASPEAALPVLRIRPGVDPSSPWSGGRTPASDG